MAWKDNLLDASFRGVVFECIGTTDSTSRALVEHCYPYLDGGDVEDMGAEAAHISIRAVFYGDNYEALLQVFLDALNTPGAGDLVHPVFGLLRVQTGNHRIIHDAESVDEAQVEVVFIETSPRNAFFDQQVAAQIAEAVAQHATLAEQAAAAQAAAAIERLRAANPLAVLDRIRTAMTGPLLAITSGLSVTLSGLDVLAYPRAWGNDISAIVGNLLDVREWGEQLEADWASIQSDLNAFSIFSTPSSSQPQISASTAPTEDQTISAAAVTVAVIVTITRANAAGLIMASEAGTATLSPVQIEAIVNTARSAIEATITQVRTIYGIEQSRTITEPLKDQALALQDAARAIIAARPPLILRTVNSPGNLRLIAHEFYADHSRAAELQRLNNLRLPNFVQAGDQLHAYAS
jgi:prophage DNA circulation protein